MAPCKIIALASKAACAEIMAYALHAHQMTRAALCRIALARVVTSMAAGIRAIFCRALHHLLERHAKAMRASRTSRNVTRRALPHRAHSAMRVHQTSRKQKKRKTWHRGSMNHVKRIIARGGASRAARASKAAASSAYRWHRSLRRYAHNALRASCCAST